MTDSTPLRAPGRRRVQGRLFRLLSGGAAACVVLVLVGLIGAVLVAGAPRLGVDFILGPASGSPDRAGLGPALVGSLLLVALTAAVALPIGVGAAVYLEEYAEGGRIARLIRANIATLAEVPSLVYGIAGLAVFVRFLSLGGSMLAAGLTLALLGLPAVVQTSREALRSVPRELREAAYSVGASRWQVVRTQVLPAASRDILGGLLGVLARLAGETAPLLVLGAVAYVGFVPTRPGDPLAAIPVQVYQWAIRPEPGFRELAAAACVVLLVLVGSLSLASHLFRAHRTLR